MLALLKGGLENPLIDLEGSRIPLLLESYSLFARKTSKTQISN